jgi:hypothetical protein
MPLRINWTADADTMLLGLRRDGTTWDAIAAAIGVSRNAAIDRGKRLLLAEGSPALAAARLPARPAAPRPPPGPPSMEERPPLCAGHPVTWELLIAGTCLEGAPYPFPVFLD